MEDRVVEITVTEQNKETRMKKNKDSLRHLWDNVRCTNIHIIDPPPPQGEVREKVSEEIFEEIIAENFPNMGNSHPSPGSRVPYRIN